MSKATKALIAVAVVGLVIGLGMGTFLSSREEKGTERSMPEPTVVPTACEGDPPVTIPAKFTREQPYPMSIDPRERYSAQIKTSCGTLYIELDAKGAPTAVNNFVNLAKDRWYNWLAFDPVAAQPGTIQAGDPSGSGVGNTGYLIKEDPTAGTPYEVGDVAMVTDGSGKAAAAFFIVADSEGAALPPGSTIFGKLTGDTSLQVAQKVAAIPAKDGVPTQFVWIESVRIEES